jgi:hypothetical protein
MPMSNLAQVAPAITRPEEQVVARMESARLQLAQARTIPDAKAVADGAAAMVTWLRRQSSVGLEIINDAQLLKIQAEHRMGEFLKREGSTKTEPGPRSYPRDTISPPAYSDLGISRVEAQRFRAVAEVPVEVLEKQAEAATSRGEILSRKSIARLGSRMKVEAPKPTPTEAEPSDGWLNTIICGDAKELVKRIPDASIALCFCDPVYERIEDYEWLAKECERVLIPGGNLIAQCGNLRRFEAETAMRRSGLVFVDLLAEVYPYALCPNYPQRLQYGWKPYVWMSKGPRRGEWMMNRLTTSGKRASDASKELHPWGDADEFAKGVIGKLCEPGDLVWDPFTGSGLVPAVCKQLGLSFLACEIEPEKAKDAQDRLAGIRRLNAQQPPLEGLC